MPSVKMRKTGLGEAREKQVVEVSADGKHTLSAYVKTDGVRSGGAFLRMTSNGQTVVSRKVKKSTAEHGGVSVGGWDRLYVTGEITGQATVELVCDGDEGTVWFAAPQLETGALANTVNLLVNGDFHATVDNTAIAGDVRKYPVSWTAKDGVRDYTPNRVLTSGHGMPSSLSGNAVQMVSYPQYNSVAFEQHVEVSGKEGDSFVMGGWADANSTAMLPNETWLQNSPVINYRFNNGTPQDTWEAWHALGYSREWVGWRFGCWPVTAPSDYTSIDFQVNYSANARTARFSNMFLYREQFGESYAYDDDKNVTSVANLAEQKSSMEYDGAHNLISYIRPGAGAEEKYTFGYGETTAEQEKHLLKWSKTPMGVEENYEYDAKGNPTRSAVVEKEGGNVVAEMATRTTYTAESEETALAAGVNENYVRRTYDARGNAVTRTVNPTTYNLDSVTDPAGQSVNYSYDTAKRVTGVETTAGGKTYRNAYTYENDRIKTVSHNTTSNTECDVTYSFEYDAYGRKTRVKVGDQLLSENEYSEDREGLLKSVNYGNGGKVSYDYDGYGRVTGVKYDNETAARYKYEYGANGQASYLEDTNLQRSQQTEYDLANRPCQTTIRDMTVTDPEEEDLIYRTTLEYDKQSRLSKFSEQTSEGNHTTRYSYDKDNRTTEIEYDNEAQKVRYEYDALGRVSRRKVRNGYSELVTEYEYEAGNTGMYGAGATSPLVKKITQSVEQGENSTQTGSYEYTYDSRGNILSEKRNGSSIVTYGYDALGQLVRVNDPDDKTAGADGTTWTYEYDRGGNILNKKRYSYTTEALPASLQKTYTYRYGERDAEGHDTWKDELTSIVEQENGSNSSETIIRYDAIGNMTCDGEREYEWGAGRQLRSVTMAAKEEELMVTEGGKIAGSDVRLTIEFSRLNVIASSSETVVLTAHVWKGDTEITDQIGATYFSWKRRSGRTDLDATWNSAHTGMKQVTMVQSDLNGNIGVDCVLRLATASGAYGSASVTMSTMYARHTQGTADANDRFSLVEDNMLKVTGTGNVGKYSLDDGVLKAQTDVTASVNILTGIPNKTVSFEYNAQGLRTKKRVQLLGKVTETEYILHGKLVTELVVRKYDAATPTQITEENVLHFFYDAQSRPAKVEYDGEMYSYLHNLQGDNVGIVDADGQVVVQYSYDAWGKPIGTVRTLTTKLSMMPPYRYRGYVYDQETGLYYLRNRYYCPFMQRFINSDTSIGKIANLVQHNEYVYCANVPLCLFDPNGHNFWDELIYRFLNKRQIDFWFGIATGLIALGYEHSADLLVHSLHAKPSDAYFSSDSALTNRIKRDEDFETAFTKNVTNGKYEFEVEFRKDFDLFGALHWVSVVVSPVTIDGVESYHVIMSDTYDFKYEDDYSTTSSSTTRKVLYAAAIAGNNMAYIDMNLGAINEYDITIDFYIEK